MSAEAGVGGRGVGAGIRTEDSIMVETTGTLKAKRTGFCAGHLLCSPLPHPPRRHVNPHGHWGLFALSHDQLLMSQRLTRSLHPPVCRWTSLSHWVRLLTEPTRESAGISPRGWSRARTPRGLRAWTCPSLTIQSEPPAPQPKSLQVF